MRARFAPKHSHSLAKTHGPTSVYNKYVPGDVLASSDVRYKTAFAMSSGSQVYQGIWLIRLCARSEDAGL